MIQAYWWQGMRQSTVGPGGTLYLEGEGLGDAGDVVRWGPLVLPVRWRYGTHLWAVTGIAVQPSPLATFPVFIQHFPGALTQGPDLTLNSTWRPAPYPENIQLYRSDGTSAASGIRPGEVGMVYWPGRSERDTLEEVTWGAHRLPILCVIGADQVEVQFPRELPEGQAALGFGTSERRVWGPPVRVDRSVR